MDFCKLPYTTKKKKKVSFDPLFSRIHIMKLELFSLLQHLSHIFLDMAATCNHINPVVSYGPFE